MTTVDLDPDAWDDDEDLLLSLFDSVPEESFDANVANPEADAEIEAALSDIDNSGTGRLAATALSSLQQQMQAYPTLNGTEQQRLVTAFWVGQQAKDQMQSLKRLTPAAVEQLRREIVAGDDAQTRLIASMWRLAYKIAVEQATNRYGRSRATAVLEDLVADALAETVVALRSYNPETCPKFSMYAGRVIRTTVRNQLQKTSDNTQVGVPGSWLRTKRWAIPLLAELTEALGREPTDEEVQAGLLEQGMAWAYDRLTDEQKQLPEVERSKIMRAKLVKQGTIGAIRRYTELRQYTSSAISLNSSVGGDSSLTWEDKLREDSDDSVFDSVERSELRKDLVAALNSFNDRERDILLYKFGFGPDGHMWTYAELAPKFGVSAERVRQIEQKVMNKLRTPEFAHLSNYLPKYSLDDDDDDDLFDDTPPRPNYVNRPGSGRSTRGP